MDSRSGKSCAAQACSKHGTIMVYDGGAYAEREASTWNHRLCPGRIARAPAWHLERIVLWRRGIAHARIVTYAMVVLLSASAIGGPAPILQRRTRRPRDALGPDSYSYVS